jgi:hypothetical protein
MTPEYEEAAKAMTNAYHAAIRRALDRTDMTILKNSNTRYNLGMTPALALAKSLMSDVLLYEDLERAFKPVTQRLKGDIEAFQAKIDRENP